MPGSEETTYYFISDLHIGGDAGLNEVDYEEEMIAFLKTLKEGPMPAELIIAGDMFGLWELTTIEPFEKLTWIIGTHQRIFDQFRDTGKKITVTVLAGNHDYDLLCIPRYAEQLSAYNIHIAPGLYLMRRINGKDIWVEHGHMRGNLNRYTRFKDRFAVPPAYYITSDLSATAARNAKLGKTPWLSDMESVYPNEEIPKWILSNYFYREMSGLLRWLMLPFIALTMLTIITLAGLVLENSGILATEIFSRPPALNLGLPGRITDWIIWTDVVIFLFCLALAGPLYLIIRDVHKTLRRFGLNPPSKDLAREKDKKYREAAEQVFAHHPDVSVFVYGHTHLPSFRKLSGTRYIINTGTWLKRLVPMRTHISKFPPLYLPVFQLGYFAIQARGSDMVISYHFIPKKAPEELSSFQKLTAWKKRRPPLLQSFPDKAVLSADTPIVK